MQVSAKGILECFQLPYQMYFLFYFALFCYFKMFMCSDGLPARVSGHYVYA